MPEYDFDVAFSFHQADQGLAIQLNDLLQDRFRTFIYTEQQKILAGTDGEVTFNAIYGGKARVVVVFCRKEWGETPFTRIEMTAVRNRAFDEGYGFTLFIPTDEPPTVPPWLPRTQLWLGLKTFGLEVAAGVVEHKIQTLGGEPKEETVDDRMARFKRAEAFREAQHQFLNSDTGWKAAKEAYREVLDEIRGQAGPGALFHITERGEHFIVHGLGRGCLYMRFAPYYSNVIDKEPIKADFLNGPPDGIGLTPISFEKTHAWASGRYQYALLGPDRAGFYDVSNPQREFTPKELSAHLLKRYIDVSEGHGARR